MRLRRLLQVLLFSGVGLAAASPAGAQPKKAPAGKVDPKTAEAKQLFEQGAEEYTKGNYERAIDAWQRSYDISKKPLIFESIANGWERLGQASKAREFLAKWREVAPQDEWELLDERLRNLDARISREDEVKAQHQAEDAKGKAERDELAKRAQQKQAAPKPEPKRPLTGYFLVGGGVVAVLAGVTLDLIANSRRPDAATACQPAGALTLCRESSKSDIQSSNTLATVGDVVWIVGGVAAAGGVAILLLGGPKASPAEAPRASKAGASLVPLMLPGGGGFGLVGRM